MPRQRDALPYICFASEGEPHSSCQNEPFSNDAISHEHGHSKIWIGYRHDLNTSYNGGMTFGQALARAKFNLSEAMKVKSESTEKAAQWREVFPGFVTTASSDIIQQLQQGKRAFRKATCPSNTCKARPEELLQMEWISIKCSAAKTEVFVSFQIFFVQVKTNVSKQLIGFVFQLRGHEMIAICRNYGSSLYRFQRTDGSVSPDMFIRTVYVCLYADEPEEWPTLTHQYRNPKPHPAAKFKLSSYRTTLKKNLVCQVRHD